MPSETQAPYTIDEFLNAEQEMDKLRSESSKRNKIPTNAVFARLGDFTRNKSKFLASQTTASRHCPCS